MLFIPPEYVQTWRDKDVLQEIKERTIILKHFCFGPVSTDKMTYEKQTQKQKCSTHTKQMPPAKITDKKENCYELGFNI